MLNTILTVVITKSKWKNRVAKLKENHHKEETLKRPGTRQRPSEVTGSVRVKLCVRWDFWRLVTAITALFREAILPFFPETSY